jgi:hypothetical protein
MLIDKIEAAIAQAKKIHAEYPEITDVWYSFDDVPMVEMEAAAKHCGKELEFNKGRQAFQLQTSGRWHTIFAHSIKVKARLVFDEVAA